jgi:Uma2 family endonuclease
MIAMRVRQPTDEWHASDLDGLPEGPRYEVIDGILIVSPRPSPLHQMACGEIWKALRQTAPDGLLTVGGVEVRLTADGRTAVQPDVMVAPRSARRFEPPYVYREEARHVVEVVSPASRRIDRFLKAVAYADAGIPSYWVVDLGDDGHEPSLTEYQLAGDTYALVSRATGTFSTDVPWPVTIDLAALAEDS